MAIAKKAVEGASSSAEVLHDLTKFTEDFGVLISSLERSC